MKNLDTLYEAYQNYKKLCVVDNDTDRFMRAYMAIKDRDSENITTIFSVCHIEQADDSRKHDRPAVHSTGVRDSSDGDDLSPEKKPEERDHRYGGRNCLHGGGRSADEQMGDAAVLYGRVSHGYGKDPGLCQCGGSGY